MSWTVIDSPIGELRLVENDGAVTAIEFTPFRDQAAGDRASPHDAHLLADHRAKSCLLYTSDAADE